MIKVINRLKNEGLSIKEVAAVIGLSPVHTQKLIRDERKRLGLKPMRYIKPAFPIAYAGRPDTNPEWGKLNGL